MSSPTDAARIMGSGAARGQPKEVGSGSDHVEVGRPAQPRRLGRRDGLELAVLDLHDGTVHSPLVVGVARRLRVRRVRRASSRSARGGRRRRSR